MAHKADANFFNGKRPWSLRKDRILSSYLTAYLPKIATQKRPILVVDGFAGAGKFDDGAPGSPLLIAGVIQRSTVAANFLAVEKSASKFRKLEKLLSQYEFAESRKGEFLDHVDELERAAGTHSVFLYLDPFAIRGLDMRRLQHVFGLVEQGHSIEVLVNCNAGVFVRAARNHLSVPDVTDGDGTPPQQVSAETLDAFSGGDWWREIVGRGLEFGDEVDAFLKGYADMLRTAFPEVCMHAVKEKHSHVAPKYALAFGSRHTDALLLMNDEMCKSRETLAECTPGGGSAVLFDIRPLDLVPDRSELMPLVLSHVGRGKSRKNLIVSVVRERFGEFQRKEIRGVIEQLLKCGKLVSARRAGEWRINDDVTVHIPEVSK